MPFGGAYSIRSPGEVRTFSFDFIDDLAIGDSILADPFSVSTSLVCDADSNASTLLIGSPAILDGLGAYTSTYIGYISGSILFVTSNPTNPLTSNASVIGPGIIGGTYIVNQLNGATGGIGNYAVSIGQPISSTTLVSMWATNTVVAQRIGTNKNNPIGFLPNVTYEWTITVQTVLGDILEWTAHIPVGPAQT